MRAFIVLKMGESREWLWEVSSVIDTRRSMETYTWINLSLDLLRFQVVLIDIIPKCIRYYFLFYQRRIFRHLVLVPLGGTSLVERTT